MTIIPYDLILYEDALQFHLEMCKPIFDTYSNTYLVNLADSTIGNDLRNDLRNCLRVLHNHHITHRDIKPHNILYCERIGKYVLCDFGLATYVKENIGEVSETKRVGTEGFMGPEMSKLSISSNTRIDLYYNDVFACEKLLNNTAPEPETE